MKKKMKKKKKKKKKKKSYMNLMKKRNRMRSLRRSYCFDVNDGMSDVSYDGCDLQRYILVSAMFNCIIHWRVLCSTV